MPSGGYHGQKMILRFPFLLMVQSSNGQQRADNLTRRMLHFQHPIRWLKCRSQSLWMVKKHFIIALKVTRASGISKTGRSLLISKVMLSRILRRVGFFHGLHSFSFHFPFHSFDLAWSVSLNPQGETYASTGTSGNISIHSAQPSNFGERLSTLSSGQSKFGMFCAHVCFFSTHHAIYVFLNVSSKNVMTESRRSTNCYVFGKRTDLHIWHRNKHLIDHIYLSCHVCAFSRMVSGLECTF